MTLVAAALDTLGAQIYNLLTWVQDFLNICPIPNWQYELVAYLNESGTQQVGDYTLNVISLIQWINYYVDFAYFVKIFSTCLVLYAGFLGIRLILQCLNLLKKG